MLPPFTEKGDLPPGIHPAGWSGIERRFGVGSASRENAYAKLRQLHELAEHTECHGVESHRLIATYTQADMRGRTEGRPMCAVRRDDT